MNPKWTEQRQIVIDHVRVPHAARHKFIVRFLSEQSALLDSIRSDSLISTGKPAENGRAIVTGEIDAGIEFCSSNAPVGTDVGGISLDYVGMIHVRQGRKKRCAA